MFATCALLLIASVFTSAMAAAEQSKFSIEKAEIIESDDELTLNADIVLNFSNETIDALKHGVPLTINAYMKVSRERRFIWDETVRNLKLRFHIRYQALVKLFQVIDEPGGRQQSFVTSSSAIDALGRLRGIPIMKVNELAPNEHYQAKLKVSLDIEALPLPLRAAAYVSCNWNTSSSWYQWPLEK